MRRALCFAAITAALLSSRAIAQRDVQPANAPPEVVQILEQGIRAELALLLSGAGSDSVTRRLVLRISPRVKARIVTTLDTARWKAPGLRVWVAFPSEVDHWHHYTVAALEGSAYKLGGFASPETVAFDRALGTSSNQIERALLLAALLDENGGTQLKMVDSTRVPLLSGDTHVFVRTESMQVNAFRPRLRKVAYSFLFGPNGSLKEWAKIDISPREP